MDAFLTAVGNTEMGVVYAETGIAYDMNAATDNALRYESVESNLGTKNVRMLVKTLKMLADPDMEEYLAQMTK